MDNTQVANRIKELCKLKGSSVSKMLEVCNIRKSLIYDLEKTLMVLKKYNPPRQVFLFSGNSPVL